MMLRSKVATLLVALLASIGGVAFSAPTQAAPAGKTATKVIAKAPSVTSLRSGTTSCEGQTFNHNGWTYGLGNGMRYLVGTGSAGNPRMVKVFTNDGSLANFALGPISYSGAVVESWSYNVSSYCITFPGTTKGIVIRTRQSGVGTNDTIYW